ncbi:MAG: diacylglyceryl transferase [Alphaproteobacteria bacterium]|nr:MAG: diacylglyceryl transferase [Alphaproteobacteria bacterium]
MASSNLQYAIDAIDPIDVVETLAALHDWEFDRVADDQIAMAIEGSWRTYSVSLAMNHLDETLRLICSFELDPPAPRIPDLHAAINAANDRLWTGSFTWWGEQKLMAFRYGLALNGGAQPNADQIDQVLSAAIVACERFYPAFQLVCWADQSPEEALGIAMDEAYGRA